MKLTSSLKFFITVASCCTSIPSWAQILGIKLTSNLRSEASNGWSSVVGKEIDLTFQTGLPNSIGEVFVSGLGVPDEIDGKINLVARTRLAVTSLTITVDFPDGTSRDFDPTPTKQDQVQTFSLCGETVTDDCGLLALGEYTITLSPKASNCRVSGCRSTQLTFTLKSGPVDECANHSCSGRRQICQVIDGSPECVRDLCAGSFSNPCSSNEDCEMVGRGAQCSPKSGSPTDACDGHSCPHFWQVCEDNEGSPECVFNRDNFLRCAIRAC